MQQYKSAVVIGCCGPYAINCNRCRSKESGRNYRHVTFGAEYIESQDKRKAARRNNL
jgi:hypothetical protein